MGVRQTSMLLVMLVAIILGVLLVDEAQPRPGEPLGKYASRVTGAAADAAETLYVKALANAYVLLTGSTGASVRPKSSGGAGLDLGKVADKETQKDPLKQTTAKNEGEIDDQQRLSVERYREAIRNTGEDAPMVIPEHPDDIRKRMAVVDRNGPEMKCNQEIPVESSVTTRSIELRAKSTFQAKNNGVYAWKYDILFKNHGTETVQMLTRHWIFVDSNGKLKTEVKGGSSRRHSGSPTRRRVEL